MNNKLLAMHGASRLTCVWRLTGDARSPLACIWVRSSAISVTADLKTNAVSSPNDETGRMLQCA
jgi:hypothetical protein